MEELCPLPPWKLATLEAYLRLETSFVEIIVYASGAVSVCQRLSWFLCL